MNFPCLGRHLFTEYETAILITKTFEKKAAFDPALHVWAYSILPVSCSVKHRKIRLIEDDAKCRYRKKLTCQGTLRQVFIRVYILEIQSVICWYFRPNFVNCCPSNLLTGSTSPPSPLPCVNKYTVYTYTMCKGGGRYGVLGLRQINTCRKVPL